MKITGEDLLIVIDVQNDFCDGGVLPVPDSHKAIDIIKHAAIGFEHIVLTQDWHPPNHTSFASMHPGKHELETVEVSYGPQTLWPSHCVQDTWGAQINASLALSRAELILRKGYRADIDSYSAFFENDHITPTGLAGYMRDRGLKRAFFSGLAYDFCVGFSALDALQLGFVSVIIIDACRAIDTGGSLKSMDKRLLREGILLIESEAIQR